MSALATTVQENVTLLIVCAENGVRSRLHDIFQKAGYRVVPASDASAALSVLHRQPCDLVVLDLEIEGVDGLTFCRLLRNQPATSKLPVIALSDEISRVRRLKLLQPALTITSVSLLRQANSFLASKRTLNRHEENGS